jgi:hypothetical protein
LGGLKGDGHFPAPYGEGTAMELEALINQARGGDVKAFVELTRRFQQAAYGSALTLVQDFQVAEDVVQEAFLAVSPITLIDGLASTAIDGRTG